MKRIVITGGGTGGHVFPALALAEELKTRGHEILYVGSDRGLEAKLAPQKQLRFVCVRTGPVKNQKITRLIRTFFQLTRAIAWSVWLLRKEKTDAVVGVGGYISVPVCVAAFLLRIPVFLQEQNVSVGIANRFLGRISRKVFLGFPEAARFFAKGKSVDTGNPIRKEFFSPVEPYNPAKKHLLVLGGSQGAKAINQVIAQNLDRLGEDYEVTHQTGVSDSESTRLQYEVGFKGKASVSAFIDDIAAAMQKASIVVSRSGAITVSELLQVGRPCLLIPFPRQGQNDQTDNARLLASRGVAVVVEQGEGFSERFWAAWNQLQEAGKLEEMESRFSALRRPPAIATICDLIEGELQA
jgi:UDP-N-acetylglucosamine--N-acetylmuramyl-(pentapeptide) pyrophosphoryl-undecaprenol N-acetylglucosamine transferase